MDGGPGFRGRQLLAVTPGLMTSRTGHAPIALRSKATPPYSAAFARAVKYGFSGVGRPIRSRNVRPW
jgi:hypothetical protein